MRWRKAGDSSDECRHHEFLASDHGTELVAQLIEPMILLSFYRRKFCDIFLGNCFATDALRCRQPASIRNRL